MGRDLHAAFLMFATGVGFGVACVRADVALGATCILGAVFVAWHIVKRR